MGVGTLNAVLLLLAQGFFLSLFFFSARMRSLADVVLSGLLGVFVHTLIMQVGEVRNDEWDILSALLFALIFSLMRWTAVRHEGTHGGIETQRSQANSRLIDSDAFALTEKDIHDDRLRTLGLMSSRFVHELTHPLSALTLRVSEIKRATQSEEDTAVTKAVNGIERSVHHLNQIIQSVKTYSSPDCRNVSGFVDVERVFALSKELSDGLVFGKSVSVLWPEASPAIEVAGGLTLQSQVLTNLIKNAVDAVCNLENPDKRWVKIDFMEKGGSVEISVSNGGPPVMKANRSRLFTPFFTTKTSGAGMGLGLALCREMVESVGGDIWYDEHSSNTRFVVRYAFLPHVTEADSGPDIHSNEQLLRAG